MMMTMMVGCMVAGLDWKDVSVDSLESGDGLVLWVIAGVVYHLNFFSLVEDNCPDILVYNNTRVTLLALLSLVDRWVIGRSCLAHGTCLYRRMKQTVLAAGLDAFLAPPSVKQTRPTFPVVTFEGSTNS